MPDIAIPSYTVVLDNVKNSPLKAIFFLHLAFTTFAVMGTTYFFYNLFFLLTILWSIHHKDSKEPLFICFVINVMAIVFDIIVMAAYYPNLTFGGSERFGLAMAIVNLLCRPISCIVLFKQWGERTAASSDTFGNANSSRQPKNYQDIESHHQGYPDPLAPPYH